MAADQAPVPYSDLGADIGIDIRSQQRSRWARTAALTMLAGPLLTLGTWATVKPAAPVDIDEYYFASIVFGVKQSVLSCAADSMGTCTVNAEDMYLKGMLLVLGISILWIVIAIYCLLRQRVARIAATVCFLISLSLYVTGYFSGPYPVPVIDLARATAVEIVCAWIIAVFWWEPGRIYFSDTR